MGKSKRTPRKGGKKPKLPRVPVPKPTRVVPNKKRDIFEDWDNGRYYD